MSSADLIQALSIVGAAGLTGFVTFLVAKMQHKGKPENALIDQLQEQINGLKEDVKALKIEQQATIRREHILGDYVNKLRRHITENQPPPPPPYPDGLYQ